jgi:ERCC4-related helicase
MAAAIPLPQVGDRVQARGRPWRVRKRQDVPRGAVLLGLEALDGGAPYSLTVAAPPDEVAPLPNEELQFDVKALDTFGSWSRAHRAIGATQVRETGVISGARFGRVDPQAYQLAPVLRVLSKPRPSLLIADDVGLGKTIEAGLILLELMARGRANRVLVVTPPGLLRQWRDELYEKFGLQFTIVANAAGLARVQSDLPAGISPWDALPLVLTSVDYIKKETVRNRALRKNWDLIVVDEAHGLAEAGTLRNPYRTQRTRLGTRLRESTRALVLLTATPHNGHSHSFRSLIELVEPSAASLHGDADKVGRRVGSAMARRMKSQIRALDDSGDEKAVFPKRTVTGVNVAADEKTQTLLHKVSRYCSKTAKAAAGTEDDYLVSFAMQIVKKRALSSRAALIKTIGNRLDSLKSKEEEAKPSAAEVRELQASLPTSDATAERVAQKIVRAAIPKEERRRKAEIKALNGLKRAVKAIKTPDPKVTALVAELRAVLGEDQRGKVIVFTEYLDTLEAIRKELEASEDLHERSVILQGGMSPRQRLLVQDKFEQPSVNFMLATDAASEGLNLQRRCHRIIHFELPWNPNRLEQRNGRVDRYGQDEPPVIKYLFYPDSPEDDVLHRLVVKIESMQESRVSTPDILGVLAGSDEIERGLVVIDAESEEAPDDAASLVHTFDDQTEEFIRNVKPLLMSTGAAEDEIAKIAALLDTTEPLLPDDTELEALVMGTLGASAFSEDGAEGVYRILAPVKYRGPKVEPVYPRATFRRSTAVRFKADDVEFITPRHPLVHAIAADARARLLQVYPDDRGLPPRRLTARVVDAGEVPSAVFTYRGSVTGGAHLLEESILAVRLSPSLDEIGDGDSALAQIQATGKAGSVSGAALKRLFEARFGEMAARARELAEERLAARVAQLRALRGEQADVLLGELEHDVNDRLAEIDEEERRARTLSDEVTGQQRLFADRITKPGGFEERRKAVRSHEKTRWEEIEAFRQVDDPAAPRPMGALFLVPEGAE